MRFSSFLTPALALALLATAGCNTRETTELDADAPTTAEGEDDGKEVPGTGTTDGGSTTGGSTTPTGGGSGTPTNYSGNLAQGDQQLTSGEFVDWYTVSAQPGQTITVDMTSASNLDPYLLLRGPNGQERDNDDLEGDRTRSQIVHTVVDGGGGTFQVGATSFSPGETGAYTVQVYVGQGGSSGPASGSAPAPSGGK